MKSNNLHLPLPNLIFLFWLSNDWLWTYCNDSKTPSSSDSSIIGGSLGATVFYYSYIFKSFLTLIAKVYFDWCLTRGSLFDRGIVMFYSSLALSLAYYISIHYDKVCFSSPTGGGLNYRNIRFSLTSTSLVYFFYLFNLCLWQHLFNFNNISFAINTMA